MNEEAFARILAFKNAIVYSNLLIALGAGSMYFVTCYVVKVPMGYGHVFVTSLTIFFYTFLRYRTLENKPKDSGPFTSWMFDHRTFVKVIMVSSLFLGVYLFFKMNMFRMSIIILFTLSGLLGLLYTGLGKVNLRNVSVLKTPIVALVWVLITTIFPLIYYELAVVDHWPIIFMNYGLILGLTIPFEIRDMKYDIVNPSLKTIPMLIGVKKTKFLAFAVLTTTLLLGIFFYQIYSLALVYIALIVIISNLNESSKEFWYTTILDSSIVFYALIMYGAC